MSTNINQTLYLMHIIYCIIQNNKTNTLITTDLEDLKFTEEESKHYHFFTQLTVNNPYM